MFSSIFPNDFLLEYFPSSNFRFPSFFLFLLSMLLDWRWMCLGYWILQWGWYWVLIILAWVVRWWIMTFVFSLWFLFRWSLLVSCFIVFVCSLLELLMVLMGILLLVRLWNLFYLRIDFFASFIWQLDSLFAMIASIFSSFYSSLFSF